MGGSFLGSLFGDVFCINHKFALFNFVSRNLKLKYRKSILGILWTILIPAFSAAIYFLVFQYVMKVQIPNYLVFILSGVIPWTFFQATITGGLESIVGNHFILNKVPINVSIFPLSEAFTAAINMVLALPVLLVVMVAYSVWPTLGWFQIPLLCVALFIQAYSIGLTSAILFVHLRDLRPIMSVILQVWFYLTPVVYSESMVPSQMQFIKILNPVWFVFSGLHKITGGTGYLQAQELLILMAWTALLFLIATMVYRFNRKSLVERL
ncbi:ABC transporter permease [Bdellovibrio sp. HCB185ZH]|uniref:ABC transporter permease n=1 Tax=Bdellovibrio sp. HCB185ZH TaxID=3394235 RepID=UPI0039A55D9C